MRAIYESNLRKLETLNRDVRSAGICWNNDCFSLNLLFKILRIQEDGHYATVAPINCDYKTLIEIALRYDITKGRQDNTFNFRRVVPFFA